MTSSHHASLVDVDRRLLRVFRSVVECGGLSAAEADLDVSRSTISTHLGNLESRLGLRLCQRGRAGFALTESGRLVYEETLRLLAAVDGFRARVDAAHDRLVVARNAAVLRRLGGATLSDIGLHRSGVYAAAMTAYDAAGQDGRLEA